MISRQTLLHHTSAHCTGCQAYSLHNCEGTDKYRSNVLAKTSQVLVPSGDKAPKHCRGHISKQLSASQGQQPCRANPTMAALWTGSYFRHYRRAHTASAHSTLHNLPLEEARHRQVSLGKLDFFLTTCTIAIICKPAA